MIEGEATACHAPIGTPAPLERLSLNQITTNRWSLREAVDGCLASDLRWIALWRSKVAETGLAESKRMIRESGLRVSGLCRGGSFPAGSAAERQRRLDDNRRAVEEAAELGAGVLALVCGAAPDRDLDRARGWVAEGIDRLAPFAKSYGVKLGIEPLHPMYAAELSVVVSLAQAIDLAERYDPQDVGIVVDAFHVWWDPELYAQLRRAGGRIVGYHVSDWIVPTPHLLKGRGMMGDGVIALRRIRQAVEEAGYLGPIEVEIFNEALWDRPGEETIALMKRRYLQYV